VRTPAAAGPCAMSATGLAEAIRAKDVSSREDRPGILTPIDPR
jgi:hypothetical protein